MKRLIVILLSAAVLAGAWFLASPLFIDETVDESFDFLTADGAVDLGRVMAMPEADREGMKDAIMMAAANAPETAMNENMPSASPVALSRGSFRDADAVHKGSGTATVYELPTGQHVIRLEEFRVTNGPALVVYLAKHPDPASADDVIDGGFINLGELKGNVGSQNYVVPEEAAIDEFSSVVIWCELFSVLFSPAALEPT